jgi:hypothetical protein
VHGVPCDPKRDVSPLDDDVAAIDLDRDWRVVYDNGEPIDEEKERLEHELEYRGLVFKFDGK